MVNGFIVNFIGGFIIIMMILMMNDGGIMRLIVKMRMRMRMRINGEGFSGFIVIIRLVG